MQNIKGKLNTGIFTLVYTSVTAVFFIVGFMLLKFPEATGDGVIKGIELCLYTLVPSMFPFMFLVSLAFECGIIEKSGAFLGCVTRRLFGLPGVCGTVIFLSMIGGLPIGAKMVEELYKKGYITERQGQRMMFFCINPGPSFVVISVGYYMIGSKTIGILLYASVVISSIIIGILSSLVWNDPITVKKYSPSSITVNFREALVNSVSESLRKMLNICGWVVLFSCFMELIDLFPVGESTKHFFYAITEITNGCSFIAKKYPLPLLAGIIGFSGICAHMQIMPTVVRLRLPLKYFLSARILNAGLSVLTFMILSDAFKISVKTIAFGNIPQKTARELSLPVCIGIMIMSILLLLGDNYRIRKNREKII